MVISKKTIIFQGFRGGPTLTGGGGGEGDPNAECYTFLKKPIKYVIFQGALEPLSHLWTRECNYVSYCPKFWTGPQQLEKMPSDPVAA